MNARALMDETRQMFSQDAEIAPNRAIIYTPKLAPSTPVPLNAFVGVGVFNKAERDAIGRFQSFSGLPLAVEPEVLDTVLYDGIEWKVVRYTKLGDLYTVVCENKRHNGRPQV